MTEQKSGMRLIGKAPAHVDKSDLLDYFLYVFEFSWSSVVFEEMKSSLGNFFADKAKEWYPGYESFSLERQWWLYTLIAMHEITKHEQLKFGEMTVEFLLSRLSDMPESLLEAQVNEVQHSFYDEVPDVLLVRPLEIEKLHNSTIDHDLYLPFFIVNKDRFVKVFEKHLRQKDMNKEYMERFTFTSKRHSRKFSTYWEGYYEMFINYFIALYDFRMPEEMESMEEEYDLLQELLILFFVGSVQSKPKIEDVVDELMEIMKDFVAQNGKWDSIN